MYLLKKFTALISAYLLFATSLAYANSSADSRAAEIMRKVKVSKNEMIHSQLEEIGALRDSMKSLSKQISIFADGRTGELFGSSLSDQEVAKIGAIVFALSFMAIVLGSGGPFRAKDLAGIAGFAGAVGGLQYGVAEYADRLTEEQVESLSNSVKQLEFAISQINEDEVDTEALKNVRQELERLSEEQKKLQRGTVAGYAVVGLSYISAILNVAVGFFLLGGAITEILPYFNTYAFIGTALAIVGTAGLYAGIEGGILENTGNIISNEDFKSLSIEIDKIAIRLDGLTRGLEAQIK